jgi:hypothetical protein
VVTSDVDLLCKDLIKHKDDFQLYRLVITGSGPVSLELYKGVEIQRTDLKNTYGEADIIILDQLAVVKPQSVIVQLVV